VTCEGAAAPPGQQGRPSWSLTLQQVAALLAAWAGQCMHAYIALCVGTGIRTEEIRALDSSSVDLDGEPGSRSAGAVGDAYDNALAESVMIGLFKTELVTPRGPWRTPEQVEIATLDYVDWFNIRRLYEACGDIPPAELEAAYYRQDDDLAKVS
jgi:hypothetical protein